MKEKTYYVCCECGYRAAKWMGKCPQCGVWNTLMEQTQAAGASRLGARQNTYNSTFIKLVQVESSKSDRIITSINEFNRVTGGGIVKDSLTIITSPPGGGKSTLTLAIANDVAKQGLRVIYATGEESESQIKSRADRILDIISENIWIVAGTSLDHVMKAAEDADADLLIIDSIQTFTLQEFLPARAGNPTQTMECASALVQLSKNRERQRAIIIIGQMNKNDEIAGLRALEHLVDTVLVIDADNEEELRAITSTKNRFGSTGEIGFFSMTEQGLISIDDPSEFFVTKRENGEHYSGSAITVLREGSRPIIAEVESLVSNSFTPYPSRIVEALKREQLNTVISILEQRGGIDLFNKNVVIKTTGGIKLKEPSVNLAMIISIASSALNKPVSSDIAFISDVGLTGELKKVPALDNRIKELDRMGFKQVVIARGGMRKTPLKSLEVLEFKTLSEVMKFIFKK